MFEKEAEKYAENTRTQKEIEVLDTVHDWGRESLSPEERHLWEGIRDRQVAREQGFKDGAEFGYNKANKWHYVKDGDLPKESKKYYVYSEEWGVEVRKFIADAGCFECRNNIIVAWKEIVLPELKERK